MTTYIFNYLDEEGKKQELSISGNLTFEISHVPNAELGLVVSFTEFVDDGTTRTGLDDAWDAFRNEKANHITISLSGEHGVYRIASIDTIENILYNIVETRSSEPSSDGKPFKKNLRFSMIDK